ncbi:MAG: molybdopterin cofactor-binding domain-containing protein [Paracoccaceae bacterium]
MPPRFLRRRIAALWTGSKAPLAVRRVCAAIAGLSAARVSVQTPFLGGGFGRRAETDFAACATRVAIAMPGTPVKLTWSREEDMTHDYYRPAARARMSGMPGADAPQAIDIAVSAPGLLLEQSWAG